MRGKMRAPTDSSPRVPFESGRVGVYALMEPNRAIPDDEQWLRIAVDIADGRPIDWNAVTLDASAAPGRASLSLVLRLQALERLVHGHQAIRTNASGMEDVRDTILTEASRARTAQPLEVHWGPLLIIDKIGRGSFGDVYRAWDPRLAREVALKLVSEHGSASLASPVVEEGSLLARVRHPNVLTVYGAERIEGRVGIWTEYVRGETLADEVARRGPLPVEEAAGIGVDVCSALAAVHAAGLLHRDVKAHNVLRESTGRIVLSDFGAGIEVEEDAAVSEPRVAGTPLYMAPELFERKAASVESDLYSVGVLLYFLVTGRYPVEGRTFAEIRLAHRNGLRVPLRDRRPDLPGAFSDIVDALLGAGPDRRYASAAAVAAALDACAAPPAASAAAPGRVMRGRLLLAAVALLAISTAVAALGSWRWRASESGNAPLSLPAFNAPQLAEPSATAAASDVNPGSIESPTAAVPSQDILPLNAGGWVVVASFENLTGDPIFDGTIDAAVKRELEYSEHVRVAQRDRLEAALRLLDRRLDSTLDPALARAIAVRDGDIAAVITGRVGRARSDAASGQYAVSMNVVDPVSDKTMVTISGDAPDQAGVLAAVRRRVFDLREKLGEARQSVEGSRRSVSASPLPALKALHWCARAEDLASVRAPIRTRWDEVERLLERALAEDEGFARALTMMAWAVRNQGRPSGEYLPFVERAYAHAGAATPQERYFAVGSAHELRATADTTSPRLDGGRRQEIESAIEAYEALLLLQPDHYYLVNNLRNAYNLAGRADDLAPMAARMADAQPRSLRLNTEAANELIGKGNLQAARRYAARAEASLTPESHRSNPGPAAAARFLRAYLSWREDDPHETLKLVDASATEEMVNRLPAEGRMSVVRRWIGLYISLGRLDRALELGERLGLTDDPSSAWPLADVFRARGEPDRLRAYLTSVWTDPSSNPAPKIRRIAYLVSVGLIDEAERVVERAKRQTPAITGIGLYEGQLELARGRPRAAIPLLQAVPAAPAFAYPIAESLADAWEAMGDVPRAIEALERVTGQRPAMSDETPYIWMLNRARLAGLYRRVGREAQARPIEARLLKLLAVADSGHPLVRELRARP